MDLWLSKWILQDSDGNREPKMNEAGDSCFIGRGFYFSSILSHLLGTFIVEYADVFCIRGNTCVGHCGTSKTKQVVILSIKGGEI